MVHSAGLLGLVVVHNIGVKPANPAADVHFAFVLHRFHKLLLTRLREAGLAEFVAHRGHGITPDVTPPQQCALGAPLLWMTYASPSQMTAQSSLWNKSLT